VGLCKKVSLLFFCSDSVPVHHRDHEGWLSGRRENQTQPHVDVHQRETRQEEQHDLMFVRNLTWHGLVVNILYLFQFFICLFVQYIMFTSLILESLGFPHDDGNND